MENLSFFTVEPYFLKKKSLHLLLWILGSRPKNPRWLRIPSGLIDTVMQINTSTVHRSVGILFITKCALRSILGKCGDNRVAWVSSSHPST